ncbi:DUF596 domain-containing protein [Actinobacillus capsulatus]|uniref:DUF596 domain-containing protein n=1 Tax=Actinobacillus capsulatus TaxID=717 RepID=UPI00037E3134|nr:DUF596 domain-containing protein [Actinobacillus capsulatus]
MKNINYIEVIKDSKFKNINAIYFALEAFLIEINITDYNFTKRAFIECIEYIVTSKQGIIKFREWVENHDLLDKSNLEIQLNYIYRSFPEEYDEDIPEKDINNLWWYVKCPVDIGWLQDNGNYFFCG